MSREALAKIARLRGIDTRGKTEEQLRQLILAHTQEQQRRRQDSDKGPKPILGRESEHQPMNVFCMDCGVEIEISGYVVGLAKELSNVLRKMGQKGMQRDEVARCDYCSVAFRRECQRRAIKATQFRKEFRKALAADKGQAYLLQAPQWWRDEYEPEIAEELKRVDRLSTRKENSSFKVD